MGKYGMTKRGHTPKWDFDFPKPSGKTSDFFNGSNRHPVDDFWDSYVVPKLPWDWNDYGSVNKWSHEPLIGPWFATRKEELEDEERRRMLADKAHNMGFDLDDVTYPISAGVYGNPVGLGDYFEASEAVINMFSAALLKWI